MLTKMQEALKKFNKKLWLMYNVNNSDTYFCKYISNELSTNSIFILTETFNYLLVSSLDIQNISKLKCDRKNIKIIEYSSFDQMLDYLEDIIANLKFPNEISLSYSTMRDLNTDILTHGSFIEITKILKSVYTKYSKKVKFSSAESVIYEIESEKTSKQISRLKKISNITNDILEKTFNMIKVGMTEIEISDLTQKITKKVMDGFIGKYNIQNYDMAWDGCPIVLTGENLQNGGHTVPSSKRLKYGDTIYFDFGLKVIFDDEEILFTDIQRMGYALKQDEHIPPNNVMKIFDTLVKSIDDGIEAMKPGVKGYVIDNIVRSGIIMSGYPDYNHATGHPVGLNVHDLGTIISIKGGKRSSLGLVENGVYTLEPRIGVPNGGSIEEMIQVTKYGGIPLCPQQKSIYLVK